MAFVEVADVITQTGVDADWSGLSAMPSVTTTTYGTGAQQVTHYFIPDPVRITCQGTVSHDPDKETLIFDRDHVSFPALVFEAGSVWNFGVARTLNSVTNYSVGVGIINVHPSDSRTPCRSPAR